MLKSSIIDNSTNQILNGKSNVLRIDLGGYLDILDKYIILSIMYRYLTNTIYDITLCSIYRDLIDI